MSEEKKVDLKINWNVIGEVEMNGNWVSLKFRKPHPIITKKEEKDDGIMD